MKAKSEFVPGPRLLSIAMTDKFIETISLDTQVFVATGFGYGSKSFQALKGHFASGRLKLIMSDITVREVHARIRKAVAEELMHQRQFRNKASVLFNSSLPEANATVEKLDEKAVADDLCAQFDHFLDECHAEIIDSSSLPAGDVLDKYFAGEPPFGNDETKKSEFPDAFAIQSLSEWAQDRDIEMFVVSSDKLFIEACEKAPGLIPKKTLAEVLDHVASDDKQLADFLRAQTMQRVDEIAQQVTEEFEGLYFWVEDEDGEATVKVTEIAADGEPEIIEIGSTEAALQVDFQVSYKADLSYDDSATAVYSEGTLLYAEHREEEVYRKCTLSADVNVQFEHTDPAKFEIVDVSLVGGSDGFGIETERNHGWPWK